MTIIGEECNPKTFSANGFVMVEANRPERIAIDFYCAQRVDTLCARKNLQCLSSFYLRILERGDGGVAHVSHFEPLK